MTSRRQTAAIRLASFGSAGAIIAAACGSSSTDIDTTATEIDTVDFVAERPTLSAIADRFDADSVTLVETVAFDFGSEIIDEPVIVTEGMPCASSADIDACQDDFARLLEAPGSLPVLVIDLCYQCESTRWSIIITSAAGPEAIEASATPQVFTPIRSAQDVSFVRNELVPVRQADDGWEFVTTEFVADCDPVIERTTLWSVTTDGAVAELRSIDTVEAGVCI